jgi:hypothetical protein
LFRRLVYTCSLYGKTCFITGYACIARLPVDSATHQITFRTVCYHRSRSILRISLSTDAKGSSFIHINSGARKGEQHAISLVRTLNPGRAQPQRLHAPFAPPSWPPSQALGSVRPRSSISNPSPSRSNCQRPSDSQQLTRDKQLAKHAKHILTYRR